MKKIFIYSCIVLILLGLFVFSNANPTGNASLVRRCLDSDGGQDYNKKGTVQALLIIILERIIVPLQLILL